jgi:hypothetical protein
MTFVKGLRRIAAVCENQPSLRKDVLSLAGLKRCRSLAGLPRVTEVSLHHGKLVQIPKLDLLRVLAPLHFHDLFWRSLGPSDRCIVV